MPRYFKNGCEVLVIEKDVVGIANISGYYYKDEDGLHQYSEGYYDLKNKCEVDISSYGVKWGVSEVYNENGEEVEIEDAILEGVFYWDGHNHKFIELIGDVCEYEEVEIEIIENKLVTTEYTITNGSKKLQKISIDGDESYAVYQTATAYTGDWCDMIYLVSEHDAKLIIEDDNFSRFDVDCYKA